MRSLVPELSRGVLDFRPSSPVQDPPEAGLHLLPTPTRPALLYVPDRLPPWPAPLLVAFHQQAGDAHDTVESLRGQADRYGALLLAPQSAEVTWDAVQNTAYGDDAAALQQALADLNARFRLDRDRIAVAGFSDGASYALGLGLANGDLFTRVLAYSPRHIPPGCRSGRPALFVSHGRMLLDRACSHGIVSALEDDGYYVTYVEHREGHCTPPSVIATSAELLA